MKWKHAAVIWCKQCVFTWHLRLWRRCHTELIAMLANHTGILPTICCFSENGWLERSEQQTKEMNRISFVYTKHVYVICLALSEKIEVAFGIIPHSFNYYFKVCVLSITFRSGLNVLNVTPLLPWTLVCLHTWAVWNVLFKHLEKLSVFVM